jgi:N-acetylglutamate synthase-like GNAT family acetyltransferase
MLVSTLTSPISPSSSFVAFALARPSLTLTELGSLVVSEDHQRRGIGTQILELFLEETDSLGLQAVLGASKQGRDLYKRYGFRDFHITELKLWEYEGGEGLEIDEHVIMHRPAKIK